MLDLPFSFTSVITLCIHILFLVSVALLQVEKEKIHDHERAYAYEHLNLLLHYIMGMKVSMEGLQPQGLEVAGHKLVELQQSLKELEARVSQLSTTSSGPPVQGAAAAAASSSSSSSGPPGPPASVPLPPPPTLPPTLSVSTSFTPLPSSVGAALELQLHSEKTKVAELGRRCTELEVKAGTFENVVCVLNREVERFATTMEASNRQHKLDQDKIEALSNKVSSSHDCSIPCSLSLNSVKSEHTTMDRSFLDSPLLFLPYRCNPESWRDLRLWLNLFICIQKKV